MAPKLIELANGVTLEPLQRGAEFLGWGRITAGDVPLRSGRRPMFVEIRNPDGIRLRDYRIVRQRITPQRVVFELVMCSEQTGIMDWMVHTVRNRYCTVDWTQPPQPATGTRLRLEIRPVNRTLGGRACVGFRYQYSYRSRRIPIYKILDRATWEPGGRAVGNEFWMRNCFVPSIVPITAARQFHSTEWYLPSCENPSVVQFLPLQTELQGFTFTAHRRGTLVTWATGVGHIRSLFEKPRQADELVHWHEHCGDLAKTFRTVPVEVLWADGGLDRVGRANLYEAVKELVHDTLHAAAGLRRERVRPYGHIEEWGPAHLARYTQRGLPKLLAAGVKHIYLANHFQNNMNVWGVSNFCCTVDHQMPDARSKRQLLAFCRKAGAAGAQVQMWANTALSTLTWQFDNRHGDSRRIRFLPRAGSVMEALTKAAAPFVRNPSNAIEADHYTPVFAVLNLRDPVVRAYWLRRWKQARDQIGLTGIFLDSSFNLSSDKFHFVQRVAAGQSAVTPDQTHLLGHYRPAHEPPAAILSQYRAHLDLVVAMQRLGYLYYNEDLGVFGVHRHGPSTKARLDTLFLWSDCIAGFDPTVIRAAGGDPDDVFFRGLAYRMMWALHWDIQRDALSWRDGGLRDEADRPQPQQLAWLRAFAAANDFMQAREILPNETGVLYRAGKIHVLWAFQDCRWPLAGRTRVLELPTQRETMSGELSAQRHHVYLIGTA